MVLSAVQEVGDVYPQCVRHQKQVAQLHLVASLHALDRGPVDAGLVSEPLLGHVLVQSPDSDAVADGSAGVENPWRLVGGWHPTNALAIMIISQQQI